MHRSVAGISHVNRCCLNLSRRRNTSITDRTRVIRTQIERRSELIIFFDRIFDRIGVGDWCAMNDRLDIFDYN